MSKEVPIIASNKGVMKAQTPGVQFEKCQLNLRRLVIASMMFAQEHDERFAFAQANFVLRLRPYVPFVGKDARMFYDPKSGRVFGMNARMANLHLAKISNAAQTVLFYTGSKGKLDFNYDGRAKIAFVDGRVKAVSRAEAAKLRWNP